MKATLPSFTETLGQAVDAVEAYVAAKGYTFKDLEAWRNFWAFCGGVSYETNKEHTAELETGKPKAKRFVHVNLYRMPSGRYELVAYTC